MMGAIEQTKPGVSSTIENPHDSSTPMAQEELDCDKYKQQNDINGIEYYHNKEPDESITPESSGEKGDDINDPSLHYSLVESRLRNQLLKLEFYKQYLEQQDDCSITERLTSLIDGTRKDLELLSNYSKQSEFISANHFTEQIEFKAVPTNPDLKDKELQIKVLANNLDPNGSASYVVAEFVFPPPTSETLGDYLTRRYKQFRVQPSSLFTNVFHARQVDKAYSNTLYENRIIFNPITCFYIDNGRSRTFKRKFKPIKLTFWKSGCLYDDMLGSVQFKIDEVSDQCTLSIRSQLKRRLRSSVSECIIDVEVKVREPLVDKSARSITQEILKFHH